MKHEVVQAVDGCTDTFAEQRYRENEVFEISGFEARLGLNKSENKRYKLYVVLRVHQVPDLHKKTGTKEFEKYIRRVKALEKSSAFFYKTEMRIHAQRNELEYVMRIRKGIV